VEHNLLVFISACLGLITVILLTLLAAFLYVLWKIRKLLEAVEVLTNSAHDQLERLREASERVRDVVGLAGSVWTKALAVGLGTAVGIWMRRRKAAQQDEDGRC
jgi:hypothetical protein